MFTGKQDRGIIHADKISLILPLGLEQESKNTQKQKNRVREKKLKRGYPLDGGFSWVFEDP
jgi:hypothetical protein